MKASRANTISAFIQKPNFAYILYPILGLIPVIFILSITKQTTGAQKNHRELSIYNIHTKEKIRVVYKKNGRYQQDAMKKINHIMRDWRRNEVIKIDPKLIDLMWEVHNEVGSRKPIHLISGYRSQKTNNMLRRSRGGQARRSQHVLGRAADIHFPDVAIRQLRYSALVRERGGVGYYPTSALPFVHLDTGRVRHWPRMPRVELAALFPNGRSKHIPRDGKPITKKDYQVAMKRLNARKRKAIRLAQARSKKNKAKPAPIQRPQYANLTAPMPLGTTPPKQSKPILASLPPNQGAAQPPSKTSPSNNQLTPQNHMKRLAKAYPAHNLAEETKSQSWDTLPDQNSYRSVSQDQKSRWARAPSYDEEHPDELSYQPFPILPLMKDISVSFDSTLVPMSEPDYKRVENLIGDPVRMIPLRFRPGLQFAEMLWASEFKGSAIVNMLTHDQRQRIVQEQRERRKLVRNP